MTHLLWFTLGSVAIYAHWSEAKMKQLYFRLDSSSFSNLPAEMPHKPVIRDPEQNPSGIVGSVVAFALEGKEDWSLLLWLFPQRFFHR